MLVSDRTHPVERDLDWLPARIRRWRAIWRFGRQASRYVGLVALAPLAVLVAVSFMVPLLGEALVFIFKDTMKSLLPEPADRDAPYDHPSPLEHADALGGRTCSHAELAEAKDGELVRVSGRVEVPSPLRGVLGHEGACRRLAFRVRGQWLIHEAAVDFWLVGDDGARTYVQAADARVMTRLGPFVPHALERFTGAGSPHGVREQFDADRTWDVPAVERVIAHGERVVVVGRRTSMIDASGDAAGYREPPRVPALAAGPRLPLLIARALELGAEGPLDALLAAPTPRE